MERGILIVVSGPSGVGKGCVCKSLLQMDKQTELSISVTTRSPREGEVNGRDYIFITKDEFSRRRDSGELLEWAEVFGNFYGTLRSAVDEKLNLGINIILEIDTQGAAQIKDIYPDALLIFIMPPSYDELQKRITQRNSETEESLKLRLSMSESEISRAHLYDYRLVNEDIEETARQLLNIIAARRNLVNSAN